ncbi:MAG: phosphonate metabolism protein/1,5-bisphosphokinase (PRPP-forming) PhnN [Pseudomonadota bacterium]
MTGNGAGNATGNATGNGARNGAGPGRLIAVVGPSGVGKDSLIDALIAAEPGMRRARRVITRPASAGGEEFEGVSEAQFHRRREAGAFALSWGAHGLYYGIPIETVAAVTQGAQLLANLSRGALSDAAARYPAVHVLSVTAPPEVLVERLAHRGRETQADIARRLARPAAAPPPGMPVTSIENAGPIADAVAAARAALGMGR